MSNSAEEKQIQTPPKPNSGQEEPQDPSIVKVEDSGVMEDEEDEEDEDEGQELPSKPLSREAQLRAHKLKIDYLFCQMQTETVHLRVHDVLINSNAKTKKWLIEAELQDMKSATTLQGLLEAAGVANARLRQLDIFDSVRITFDSGPPELPGTTNVIVEVVETSSPITGKCGVYMKTAARSSIFDGSLKYKNWFGYGDVWDGSVGYAPNQTSEVSAGVFLPRFKGFLNPVLLRVSLLSQDWQELSSYKERMLGLSLRLFSTSYHDLEYNLGWRTLMDPSTILSRSVRRQLGHGLLSSLKYTFKIDRRNSPSRPIKGFVFVSTTQVGGLSPDHRSLRFLRQELKLRYAVPFGFCHAALNFGIFGGVLFPWGCGFLNKPSPLPERFFLGVDFSPICTLAGPTTIWGSKTTGLGTKEPIRQISEKTNDENSSLPRRDFLGGDLAVAAFADLSFDLPIKLLRERGVHGHIFAGAGNLAKLTENEFRNFSFRQFLESFQSSVGVGIVFPTKLFRLEGNFYYMLKQDDHDCGKTGFRLSFSAPS